MIGKLKSVISLITISIILLSCGSAVLQSNWADDTDNENWRKYLTYFEDENISISTINNQDELKIYIVSADRGKIMQFLGQGLTIWFENSVSDNDKVGINFPIKNDETIRLRMMSQNKNDELDRRMEIEKMLSQQSEFLLVSEKKFPLGAYPILNGIGIEPKLNFEMGQLIYSIKVPLQPSISGNFDLQYSPGETMTVGFELGEIKKEGMNPEGRSRGMGSGGRRPGSGGMSGGKRGSGMNVKNRPEPLDITVDVLLAKSNANQY